MFGPLTRPETSLDPLAVLIDGARARGRHPVPLVATRLAVDVAAGLAVVSMTRLFRNDEAIPIEATITLPVPVDAAVFALEARIGGRVLAARATAKAKARAAYEDAIDRGKPAALHEELLPGIHMLSLANLLPGGEAEVTIRFALPMQAVGEGVTGDWRLRIPLTVGDVYGRSPLPASDDLVHAPSGATADLLVSGEGRAELAGGTLADGRAVVPLSAPVDLVVRAMPARPLATRLGGDAVTLALGPAATGRGDLDVAVLVDVSGSMDSPFAGVGPVMTKYQAAVLGLLEAAKRLGARDRVALFEFNDKAQFVGQSGPEPGEAGRAPSLEALVLDLSRPGGGTEIGGAIAFATETSAARDVVVVTDGKSHALDVAALAASGRRFHGVLIGEDALDASLGGLAIATGGRLHVPVADALAGTITRALDALRVLEPDVAEPGHLVAHRGATRIEIGWREAAGEASAVVAADSLVARGAAALAAQLRLPHLAPEEAASLSAEAGLANHLTSLVLVDEAAEASDALPAMRKVPLATPRTSAFPRRVSTGPVPDEMFLTLRISNAIRPESRRAGTDNKAPRKSRGLFRRRGSAEGVPGRVDPSRSPDLPALSGLPDRIDFGRDPDRLANGNLSALPVDIVRAVEAAAATDAVRDLAARLGVDPVRLVIAFLALAARRNHRSGRRVARAILGGPAPDTVLDLARSLGLHPEPPRGWLRG
jgi:hypothetical protein